MEKKNKIIIATRGSRLALWQAEWVKSGLLKINPDLNIELNKIKTTGDKILDVPLAQVGGKGLFVKEIEEAMLKGKADLAVHSMKDVPTDLPEGLHLSAICKREDPRDAFIAGARNTEHRTQTIRSFKDLPQGAHVGTSSLRRICQILNKRPDLKITQLRGNVDTRIRKLDEGQFDAIILATAGVKRLDRADRITEILSPDLCLPAIGQGAVGIECRVDDEFINNILKNLNHEETSICVRAERAFLKKLEGGCQVPIAAYAELKDGDIVIKGLVGSLKGETLIKNVMQGKPEDAESLGKSLAEKLLSRGADKILAEVYR
ncbi:MAG TPA: hydroxymethylbilane synthase [Nitrospirae bacterium]|nr:porphobilinogen deaminase [bacterium BMS3Abin06]HDH12846.1 hydroxymethylbilane synthase [Nitrospirota bacterium]HDZ01623.1 hydroxymethylbilane synthase [Nitrospirota bacterium]